MEWKIHRRVDKKMTALTIVENAAARLVIFLLIFALIAVIVSMWDNGDGGGTAV